MPTRHIVIEMGEIVICDFCSSDFTFSDKVGGMLFVSKGCCPDCLPSFMKKVERYNEQEHIRARAFPGETFRNFILRVREGDYRSPVDR